MKLVLLQLMRRFLIVLLRINLIANLLVKKSLRKMKLSKKNLIKMKLSKKNQIEMKPSKKNRRRMRLRKRSPKKKNTTAHSIWLQLLPNRRVRTRCLIIMKVILLLQLAGTIGSSIIRCLRYVGILLVANYLVKIVTLLSILPIFI